MRWQHFEELEADFQQYYNLDVAYVKPARAARLLFQLPRTCRVFLSIEPANQWGWSEVLLNKIEYALQVLAWQNTNEGVKKVKQTEKPVLFRPDFIKDKAVDSDIERHDTDSIKELLAKPRV